MRDLALNIFIRPFIVLALFGTAFLLARAVRQRVPDSPAKAFLFQRRKLTDGWVILMCFIWIAVVLGIIWLTAE